MNKVYSTFSPKDRTICLEGVPNENLEILLKEFEEILKPYTKYTLPDSWPISAICDACNTLNIQRRHDLVKQIRFLFDFEETYVAEYIFRLSIEDLDKYKNGYDLTRAPAEAIKNTLVLSYKKVSSVNIIHDLPKQQEMKIIKSKVL